MILTKFMMGDECLRSVTIAILFPFSNFFLLLFWFPKGKGKEGCGGVVRGFRAFHRWFSLVYQFSHESLMITFSLSLLSVIFHFFSCTCFLFFGKKRKVSEKYLYIL